MQKMDKNVENAEKFKKCKFVYMGMIQNYYLAEMLCELYNIIKK